MNELIIKNWNARVDHKDTIFILGDVFMGQAHKVAGIIPRLNGNKCLIRGNHDPDKMLKHFESHLGWVKDYYEKGFTDSKGRKRHIVMSHFPMASWHRMGHSSIMLHGHTHGSMEDVNDTIFGDTKGKAEKLNNLAKSLGMPPYRVPLRRLEVGVDCQNMAPISLEEVIDKMDAIPFVSVDHHDAEGSQT